MARIIYRDLFSVASGTTPIGRTFHHEAPDRPKVVLDPIYTGPPRWVDITSDMYWVTSDYAQDSTGWYYNSIPRFDGSVWYADGADGATVSLAPRGNWARGVRFSKVRVEYTNLTGYNHNCDLVIANVLNNYNTQIISSYSFPGGSGIVTGVEYDTSMLPKDDSNGDMFEFDVMAYLPNGNYGGLPADPVEILKISKIEIFSDSTIPTHISYTPASSIRLTSSILGSWDAKQSPFVVSLAASEAATIYYTVSVPDATGVSPSAGVHPTLQNATVYTGPITINSALNYQYGGFSVLNFFAIDSLGRQTPVYQRAWNTTV